MTFKDVDIVLPVWNIYRVDPGYIYILESNGRYKIGKTKRTRDRLKAAKTWLPDLSLIGFKPFWGVSHHERMLHAGFANYWYSGEWFNFETDNEARDLLIEGFVAFSDDNPDTNSIDFAYWYNGEGMIEFQMAMHNQKLTLPKFQKQESANAKTAR